MADIKKELNDIKNAVYGREVRGSIHDGIKKINDEAESAKHQVENIQQQVNQLVVEGDSSVEAAQARVDAEGKSYPTLKARLDKKETEFSSQLAQKTQEINDLQKNKIDKTEAATKSELAKKASKEDVARLSDGTPLFANGLSEMTDNTKNYVNLDDGFVYAYNSTTSNFESTGLKYQSQGLSMNSINTNHTTFATTGKNLFDKSKRNIGYVVSAINGELVESGSGANSSTDFIPVKPLTTYYKNHNTLTQIAYYDINKNFISGENPMDNEFTTPANCYYIRTNFSESDADVLQIEEGNSFTGYEEFYLKRVFTEKEQLKEDVKNLKQQIVDLGANLGVRYSLTDNTAYCERIDGFTFSDLDELYPFNSIKLCNLQKTEWGATKITYADDPEFTRDGSNGDVMVEIPKHYFRRYRKDGYEYLEISGKPKDGFVVDPAFVENGKELEKIYVAAYDGYVNDGELRSWSGVNPNTEFVLNEMRQFATNKGKGFALLDYRTVAMLQRLFVVYFANRNSEVVGRGMTDFPYQSHPSTVALYSENNTNTIIVDEVTTNPNKFFQNGQTVMVSEVPTDMESPFRTITSLTRNGNETVITFDGDPYDVVAGETRIFTRAQKTGLTDDVSGHTGMSNYFGGKNGYDAVKWLHIENLWGNVWNELDGIALHHLIPYVGENIEDYTSDVTEMKSRYKPLSKKLPLQESNYQGGGPREWEYYIKNLMLDPLNPAYQLPYELGGGATKDTHFTDPFYSHDREFSIPSFGGGYDHMYRSGMFTLRFWYTPTSSFRQLNGARLIYKPL